MVGNYKVEVDDQKTLDRLYDPSFEPRLSLILSSPVNREFNIVHDPTSEVEIKNYTPMKMVFKTTSATDQLLFLSDTWYPGWQAKLETGKKLPVLTAFTALRAVPVPAGDHTITMWYFPAAFKTGLTVALVTLATVGFMMLIKTDG